MTFHLAPLADRLAALRRALGQSVPPAALTQPAFDSERGHLERLVTLAPDQPASSSDLWEYSQDLRYTEIQTALLVYLLPWCLRAWHEDLRGVSRGAYGYGAFVEHFYPVLADRRIFDEHLTAEQTEAVTAFMHASILEEIDDQRGLAYRGSLARPYRWTTALMTYGVLRPDIERMWSEWWSLATIGRAVAAVQFASMLIYDDQHNPVFAPWTSDEGGGPPTLWEYGGHLYEHRWLQPNIDFLERVLTVDAVRDLLSRAVEKLAGEQEHEIASLMLAGLPSRREMLGRRCEELPKLLATRQEPSSALRWPV